MPDPGTENDKTQQKVTVIHVVEWIAEVIVEADSIGEAQRIVATEPLPQTAKEWVKHADYCRFPSPGELDQSGDFYSSDGGVGGV